MNQLAQIALFNQINQDTLDQIWQSGKVITYTKGEHCFKAREQTSNIYILLKGTAAIYNITHSGKRKTIFYLKGGTLLNDEITKLSLPSVSCETINECKVFVISKDNFLTIMAKDFNLTQVILVDYERKIFRLTHQLKNTLGCVYLERKLASKLWKLAKDFGIQTERGIYIDIPLSITELADFVGAPRESISRAMKKLTEKGLVDMEGKKIFVINPDKMSIFYKTGKMQ